MKPICTKCRRFFRPKKNGVYFIEGMPNRDEAPPGTADPSAWSPYKLWCGDLWECQGCGAEVIVGVGRGPVDEHYRPGFAERASALGADLQINDC